MRRLQRFVLSAGAVSLLMAAACSSFMYKASRISTTPIASEEAVEENISLRELERTLRESDGERLVVPKPLLKNLVDEVKRQRARNDQLTAQLRAIKNIDLEERERLHTSDRR